MKNKILITLTLTTALLPSLLRAGEENPWTCDVSLYGLAAGMSGDVTVRGKPAEVDFGFDKVWDNLDFAMMGKVRVGYDRWALTTDLVYMDLEATKNGLTVDFEQWMVEPSLSYAVGKGVEVLAGTRYNNLSAGISGGPLGFNPSDTRDWWDPIVGANLSLPLGRQFSFNVRGDIGGFGVGSDLTWQAFPSFDWRFTQWGSLQLGYRWVYTDYADGSGADEFQYDMLTQGPQLGFTIHF